MRDVKKIWGLFAALNGFMAIGMGAVAAHAITDVHVAALAEKAAWYQLIHALLLLNLAKDPGKKIIWARKAIATGVLLFCGSLYLYALTGWASSLHIAPMGGISLMSGWLMIAYAFYKGELSNV